jgi:hypothetical protein
VRAAQKVRVFKMTAGMIMKTAPEALLHIFADLRRRHIELAIELGLLAGKDGCGIGEGYSAPGTSEAVARKVRELGGELHYIAMDEPLWFGHRSNGRNACHASIEEIARQTADAVGSLRRIFPTIKVGDIEPLGSPTAQDWLNDIAEWMRAYRNSVGEPMPFFHADVVWSGSWQQQLSELASSVRLSGTKFGIIYNGNDQDQSDEAWTRHAERHIAQVETGLALVPDQAILQSWMPRPIHMLPETPRNPTWNNDVFGGPIRSNAHTSSSMADRRHAGWQTDRSKR